MAEVPAPERSAGDVLDGRYRLLSRLGRGGFGDVWRAEELLPDGAPFREVALKLLVPSFADATRWTEEAKILASFRHPSLVTVYAAGLLEGAPRQPYVAMELLLGSTLADIHKQRPRIPWRRALGWARDAAAALDVIHARGVVHLDLKPANLFLAQDGALKMLDFGISQQAGAAGQAGRAGAARQAGQAGAMIPEARAARAPAADDAELATAMFVAEQSSRAAAESGKMPGTTTRRTIAGTPGFMAPEVLELGEPTAATDAYALAVCITLLTTGRLPQAIADQPPEGTTPSTVLGWLSDVRDATLRGDLRDLDADEARLPRGLLALLRRLLAVDPAQRGVSPGHLRAMLDEVWERPHGVPDPPYFGLTPLPAEAEGMLFGRDDDIARLGRELTFEPCVILQGARGVGKSSLASAGLVPYLARLGVDGKDDWRSVEVRLGEDASEDPDEALRRALAGVDRELEGADIDALAAFCDRSAVGVALVIDPLDAITTAPVEKSARLCALVEAIAGSARRPGLRAVGSIGEERTQALLDAPLGAAVPAIRARLRYVGPPSAAAVAEIVTASAKLAGATIEGADRVITDVRAELRAEGNRLPYVALALRAFWSDACEKAQPPPDRPDRPDRRAPTLRGARWQELGGVAGALVAHADRVVRGFDPETRAIADELLLRLSATDATPLSWDQAELLDAVGEPGGAEGANGTARASAERVLARLAGAYLARVERGQVAIGHPSLLTKWQHLASTRLREMQRLAFLERLRDAALAWDRASNHEDFLLPDAVLRDVRERRAWMARGPSARERELVRASLRRRRVQIAKRVAIGGSVVLALAGGLLAKNAYDDRQAAADAARKAAEQRAYAAELVTAERSREDPFQRAALIAEAMRRRSADAALPLDLAVAVASVPRARFLTLEPVASPTFPWNDRWLLGGGPGGALTIVDLWPADAGAIEDMSIDADPESPAFKSYMREPRLIPLRLHADAVAERTPFAFDTAFATRSISGEVRVFRLRDDSSVALAAVAPMRCAGSVRAAEAAPVLACATDEGLARWDLRGAKEGGAAAVDRLEFLGTVLDVSADGALVAATDGREVRLWEPGAKRSVKVPAGEPVLAARFSPRDRVIALVRAGSFEVLAVDGADQAAQADESGGPLARGASEVSPTWVRWDAGGLALAVCGAGGAGGWHGLGAASGEAPSDPPCASGSASGFKGSHGPPQHLASAADAPELAARVLGPHPVAGGWRLSNGRILTRDLVLFSDGPPVSAMLRFRGVDATGAEEVHGAGEADGSGDPGGGAVSLAAIERIDAKTVAAQVGGEVRLYSAETGRRQLTRKGTLLRVCADGRLLAWERQGAAWRVFDARGGLAEVMVPREPGLVLGADAGCGTLLTQRLDGTLVATRLGGGAGGAGGGVSSRVIGQADGYVYAVKPSAARGRVGSGLWLLASSGAIARYDDASGEARLLGYASPRATAVGDGPRPGDVAYADATGVVVLRRSGKADQVLSAASGATWEDLSVSPDGASMLLASGDRIAVLDMERRELAGEMAAEGRSRFSSWDPGGSVLAWTFDRVGGAEGQVIPRGQDLALKVAEAASNLRVENRKLVLKR